jgi:hypothetical protein
LRKHGEYETQWSVTYDAAGNAWGRGERLGIRLAHGGTMSRSVECEYPCRVLAAAERVYADDTTVPVLAKGTTRASDSFRRERRHK